MFRGCEMEIKDFEKQMLKVFSEMSSMSNRKEHTKQSLLIHMVEEVGEIARQLTNEYHRPEKFDKANLGEELADVMMFIVLLAHYYGVDLSEEMEKSVLRVEKSIQELKNK